MKVFKQIVKVCGIISMGITLWISIYNSYKVLRTPKYYSVDRKVV